MRRVFAVLAGMTLMFGLSLGRGTGRAPAAHEGGGRRAQGDEEAARREGWGRGAAASAKTVADHFEEMEKIWAADNLSDAVGWSKDAATAASDVAAKASGGDFDGAAAAAKDLGGTCRSRHRAYRQKNPDKTYSIK